MTLYIKYHNWPTFCLAEDFDSRAEIIDFLDLITAETIPVAPIALLIK